MKLLLTEDKKDIISQVSPEEFRGLSPDERYTMQSETSAKLLFRKLSKDGNQGTILLYHCYKQIKKIANIMTFFVIVFIISLIVAGVFLIR